MRDVSDGELMRMIAKGQAAAFSELFRRHGALVLGYSRRLVKNPSTAEDVSQEVWMRVVRGAKGYEDRGQFHGWLMRITRNQALNVLRDLGHHNESRDLDDSQISLSREEIESQLLARHEINNVKSAIDQLPEAQRVALVMWLSEDVDYNEIAAALGVSTAAVKSLLFRARQQLAASLGESR